MSGGGWTAVLQPFYTNQEIKPTVLPPQTFSLLFCKLFFFVLFFSSLLCLVLKFIFVTSVGGFEVTNAGMTLGVSGGQDQLNKSLLSGK